MTESAPALWVLHCDHDGQPAICGTARSESEADSQLAALREEKQQFTFFATTLSEEEVANYKRMGLIPEDA